MREDQITKAVGPAIVSLPHPERGRVVVVANNGEALIAVHGQGLRTAKIPVGRRIAYQAKGKKGRALWRGIWSRDSSTNG